MSTMCQLPVELLDQIAKELPFEELWNVRSVTFGWNEIALRRARSLLYNGSILSMIVCSTRVGEIPGRPGEAGLSTTLEMITLTSQETQGEHDRNTLVWGNKNCRPLVLSNGAGVRDANQIGWSDVHLR